MICRRLYFPSVCALLSVGLASGCGSAEGQPSNGISPKTHLAETGWLAAHLDDPDLVIIDARPTAEYVAEHIPQAVSASFDEVDATSRGYSVSYGGGIDFFVDANSAIPFQDGPKEQIQAAVRGFGINRDSIVVVYDQGGHFHATRFFWTLTRHGLEEIYILNGGIQKWKSDGHATTQEIPTVFAGDFVASDPRSAWEATTDDVFASLTDPDTILVSGLVPSWHYGSYTAYTIPGHIPTAQRMSLGYFFNSDGTWKSKGEMQTILDTVGITPDKSIITYCGGGPLSACAYFTFRRVLEYPNVHNYAGSYLAWIADPRNLPVNTYGNDHWLRDTAWCHWWVGERMQRLMPVSPALAVDVRSESDYGAGHVPWSVNIPMDDPGQLTSASVGTWAETLGNYGVSNNIEVVIVDETVTPRATLLFWLLQYLGHEKVSIASEGLAGWRTAGHAVSAEDTVIAEPITPIDVAIHPTTFTADAQPELLLGAPDEASHHPFSRVWVVSAEVVPNDVPVGAYVHIPWGANLNEDGLLHDAGTLWTVYEEAGVPYFSEIICYSDDPAEATVTYFVLRLLGFPKAAVHFR